MTTSQLFLTCYSSFVIAASFAHLIRLDYWWIRIWDFPHLQVAVLTLIGLAAWLVLGRDVQWPLVLLPIGLVAASLYQAWLMYPYTPLHDKEVRSVPRRVGQSVSDPNTVRLLTANVYQENTKTPDVLKLVQKHQPDLVLLLETNETWRRAMQPIETDYPHQVLCPLENTYGLLFYSRFPMLSHELRYLVQDDIPSIYVQLTLASGRVSTFMAYIPCLPAQPSITVQLSAMPSYCS